MQKKKLYTAKRRQRGGKKKRKRMVKRKHKISIYDNYKWNKLPTKKAVMLLRTLFLSCAWFYLRSKNSC